MKAYVVLTLGHLFVSAPLFCAQLSKTAVMQSSSLHSVQEKMQTDAAFAQKVKELVSQCTGQKLVQEFEKVSSELQENHPDAPRGWQAEHIKKTTINRMREDVRALAADKDVQEYLIQHIKIEAQALADKYEEGSWARIFNTVLNIATTLQPGPEQQVQTANTQKNDTKENQ